MKPLLVLVEPRSSPTGPRQVVRLASGASAAAAGTDGERWEHALTRRPRFALEVLDPTLSGQIRTGRGDFALNFAAVKAHKSIREYHWVGAPIVIRDASNLQTFTGMPIEFTGIVRSAVPDPETDTLVLNLEVDVQALDKPLLSEEFNGGGGVNGEPANMGTLKPAGFGACKNIEPIWVDTVRNIGMIDGYGNTLAIPALFEGASDFGPSVGDFATYAALAAAIDSKTIKPGQWGTCIAQGLIGLGAPPAGIITVDANFGANRPDTFLNRILIQHAGLSINALDVAAFTALGTAVDRPVHYWTRAARNVKELAEAIAASCNATLFVTLQGKVSVTRAFGGTNLALLDKQRPSAAQRVTQWRPLEPEAPVWRMKARAARPGTTLTTDQIMYADDLIDRGQYQPGETYRQGHIVWVGTAQYLYVNPTPTAGNAPPAPPATSNDYWEQTKEPATASDLYYEDGTSVEDLKPAGPGATRNVPRGPWATGVTYAVGDIFEWEGSSYSVTVAHLSAGTEPDLAKAVLFVSAGAPGQGVDGKTSYVHIAYSDSADGSQNFTTGAPNGRGWRGEYVDFIAADSTDPADYEWSQYVGPASFGLALQGEVASGFLRANLVGKTGGNNAWDFGAFSTEGFRGGAQCSFRSSPEGGVMGGLNSDPFTDANYTSIDYAFYAEPGSLAVQIWRNGSLQNVPGLGTFDANTHFQVHYDNRFVRWILNGAVKHTVEAGPNQLFWFDSSIARPGSNINSIAFAAAGALGADGGYRDVKFKRSAGRPAAPTTADAPGWSDGVPAGNEALWMITALRTANGNLAAPWSMPEQITGLNNRGAYSAGTTYYLNDVVTYAGSTFVAVQNGIVGQAPSSTGQPNTYWDVLAKQGEPGKDAVPPSGFVATINIPNTDGTVNLRSLADAAGYTGQSNATVTYNVPAGVTVTGLPGLPNGGAAVDTGTWPSGYTIALSVNIAGTVIGGGGRGGPGSTGFGVEGGLGGDGIVVRTPLTGGITVNPGGVLRGGGGGGGSGGAGIYQTNVGTQYEPEYLYDVYPSGGGGGGYPNGAGGAGSVGHDKQYNPAYPSTAGADGTGAGGGAPGAPFGGAAGPSGAGGGIAANGSGGGGNPNGGQTTGGGNGGAGGFAVRKNNHEAVVTNNGTLQGYVG